MAEPNHEPLVTVPLLSCLEDRAREELLSRCPVRAFPAGRVIFHAGRPAEQFYVILTGKVKVFHLSQAGDEQTLHLYGPGRAFAEAAMFAGGAYPANAEAVEDSRLLVVSRKALASMIAANPNVAFGMMAGLSAKLREFAALIEGLTLKSVPARLAAALLDLSTGARGPTFLLKQTKRQLAAQLGTRPETLSRAFATLKRKGLLKVAGPRITILDTERLGEMASES